MPLLTSTVPILLGPTAVGKTETSLLLAERINGEIVNYDARAVYKHLDIGTAKPTPAERRRVPHHLIDVCELDEVYHVQRFREDAARLVPEIQGRGRVPILVGGSTLYVEALTVGLFEGVGADPALRERMDETPLEQLYERLRQVDPATAARLHPNDRLRITRALEVYALAGEPISARPRETEPLPFQFKKVGLYRDRTALYERINARVDCMIEQGLIEEARRLYPQLHPDLPAYRTITYQELFEHFAGRWSLSHAIGKVKQHTRNYAKRQLTWHRRYDDIHWIDVGGKVPEAVAESIARSL